MGLLSQLGLGKPAIFVQIASYRDPECQWTVKDLFEKAAHPERIFVGICWQFDKEEDAQCFTVPYPRPRQVRTVSYHWKDSQGSGWARSEAQKLYKDEDYVLMIDSHMRFVKGWDELLTDMLERCPTQPAMITTTLPSYMPPNQLKDTEGLLACTLVQQLGGEGDPQLLHIYGGLIPITMRRGAPFPSAHMLCNFAFAKSHVFHEVPVDPYICFYCDELCYSARLFTHGVDFYQPDKIVAYHKWDRNTAAHDRPYQLLRDPRNIRANARAQHLLGLKPSSDPEAIAELDRYGLGNRRTLETYWDYLGVDFRDRTIRQKALTGDWGPPPPKAPLASAPAAKKPGLFTKRPTIFVQIASYRDPECQWTVKDLFEQATYPDRVFVGICWQYDKEADQDCFTEPSPRPKQTRIMHVPASESKGVCWARYHTQRLYKDEDYVLMIDSHMRFVKGWDEILITELARCPSAKPLLTHYPPGYTPPRQLSPNPRLSVMTAKPFDALGGIRGDGIALESVPDTPLRGAFIAAGFVFAKATLIIEIPHDPYLYFNQEEMDLAVRLYTHGWDVYHPTRIVLYHYYKKAGDTANRKLLHWENDKDWKKADERGRKRFHHLVGHKISADPEILAEIGHYGLGAHRTLKQFEEFTGINFKELTASTRATKAEFIPDIEKWKRPPSPLSAVASPKPRSGTNGTKPQLDKLTPLTMGNMLPPFVLPDTAGSPAEIQLYGGKRLAMFLLPVDFPDYIENFFKHYRTCEDKLNGCGHPHLFIIQGTQKEAAALREKYVPHQRVLYDETGALHHAFGLHYPRLDGLSIIVSAGQKILSIFYDRNPINQLADAVRAIEHYNTPVQPAIATMYHPPVLMVPDVLTLSMREELLDYWRKGTQYKGTIGVGADTKVMTGGKRRTDVDIAGGAILRKVDDVMAKTILPELRKVSAFEAIYRERYKIGRYGAEDAGYYHQHRDTGVRHLAYRRYSMSLILSDDYDGGMLYFPEYGPVHYKIPAGSAILFPSALLHGITPVTRGERFILVAFFHGPLEEAYRKRVLTESGEKYNEGEVQLLVEPRYTDLPQSQYLYTSSIVTRVVDIEE